jgi:23S rRNA U2552 (ribose-2'-O)-methylase RlmE/FtsJ
MDTSAKRDLDPGAISNRSYKKEWNNIKFYKRTNININLLNLFNIESNKYEHIMSEEEDILHKYRNKINEYETNAINGKNWEYYKKIVNPFELVYTQKKYDNFPESVCILKPLSRSYFKMLEILELIKFFNMFKSENVKTAHVCEGPGGFIEALFDDAFKNKKRIQTSIAMTLRSKQINIPGWKRASQFLQKNHNIKILYGEDNTGDIMKSENQQYFIDYCINPTYGGKVNIFTADGGFDFSYDYEKQEQMIFPLLLSSTKIGFEVLRKGGVFVLKLFDFYHKSTMDLIYLLSCHFSEWTLYKPCTSRPCNPEQYFIGKGFTGAADEVLDILRLWCSMIENKENINELFKIDYSDEFKNIIEELRKNSFNRQIEYLEKVFDIIEKDNDNIIQKYLKNNEISSYEWCIKFKVPISYQRYHLVVESQNDQQVSSL